MSGEKFTDRRDAGRRLAGWMTEYREHSDAIVLGLPRGGVPVAAEVAHAVGAPLDVLVARKLGVPNHPELAMGAIAAVASSVQTVRNDDVMAQVEQFGMDGDSFSRVAADELVELRRRQEAYRGDRPPLEVRGRTIFLVDDGLATGATMRAAIRVLKQERPARVVVAVPVGSARTCDEIRQDVDGLVCLSTPDPFWAVGQAYDQFDQTSDDEVRQLLAHSLER